MPYFDYVEFIGFAFPLLIVLCMGYYLPSAIRNRTLSAESHAEDRFSGHLRLLDTSVETNKRTHRGNALVLGGKMQRPTAPKQRENANFLVAKEKYLSRRVQLQSQAKYRLIALLISLGMIVVSVGLVSASIIAWPWIMAALGVTVVCLIQSAYAGTMARTELADMRAKLQEMGAMLPSGRSLSDTEKRIKKLQQAREPQHKTSALSLTQTPAEAVEKINSSDESKTGATTLQVAPRAELDTSQNSQVKGENEIVESYEIAADVAGLNYQKATFTPAQLILTEENETESANEESGKKYLDEIIQRQQEAQMIATTNEYVAALPVVENTQVVTESVAKGVKSTGKDEASTKEEDTVLKDTDTVQENVTWTPMKVPTPVYALKQMARRRHVDAKELLAEHLCETQSRVPYRPKDVRIGRETVSTTELAAQELNAAGLANVDSILEQRRAVGN